MDDTSIIKDPMPNVNHRIGKCVLQLRTAQGLSLDRLEARSGVSRSMISLIERGKSSPTAEVLEKLAVGLGVTMASLFDAPTQAPAPSEPVARRVDQPEWKDPGSGYIRRSISPPGVPQPMKIVEVHFPPGERVAFESGGRETRVYQQIWMLKGAMDITVGGEQHRLREGDCLAMQLEGPTLFHNPTRKAAHYAVVVVSEPSSRR
jgi:transcriptional regulator with XRE-family HTH domain